MGKRITSQSHSSLGNYPWPLRTIEVTTAELYDGNPIPYLIGPLDRAGVMELLYRVDEFEYAGNLIIDIDGVGTFNEDISGALINAIDNDETGRFENHRYAFNGNRPNVAPWEDLISGDLALFKPLTDTGFRGIDSYEAEIYHDTDLDEYWIFGEYYFDWDDGIVYVFGITASPTGGGAVDELIEFTLVLSSGTYTMKGVIALFSDEHVVSNTLTITATKWFAYADKLGLDAWDTTTGLPINGGPLN